MKLFMKIAIFDENEELLATQETVFEDIESVPPCPIIGDTVVITDGVGNGFKGVVSFRSFDYINFRNNLGDKANIEISIQADGKQF